MTLCLLSVQVKANSRNWKERSTPNATRCRLNANISGMQAKLRKLLEYWNPDGKYQNSPVKVMKSKNKPIPETSNGDIRSTRGSRASTPFEKRFVGITLFLIIHASRGLFNLSASNLLVYGAAGPV